jgi:glucosamine kinase
MYKLVADSGSTKTDWCLLKNKTVVLRAKTPGFNPYFQTSEQICNEIRDLLVPSLGQAGEIDEIHYYGTGCSTKENCDIVKNALDSAIGAKNIMVSHDLLAAARALCGHEWGIASILGTGSNSGLYNGVDIVENVPSTGYLWSDYGGGSQIGKFFIREYFEDTMPMDLREAFEAAGYNREVILGNVYRSAVPARYLASVSLFVGSHMNHPFSQKVLEECFDSFFEQQVNKYSNSTKYKVHTVGSVGYFFREKIAQVAAKHGYAMGNVIQAPMDGLVTFHSKV